MNELIERMKKNLAKFKCLSKNEQDVLIKAEKENCEILVTEGSWEKSQPIVGFDDDYRYRLKADYQPEPEIPVLEGYRLRPITLDGNGMMVYNNEVEIFIAPNDPNFAGNGYKLKDMSLIQVTDGKVIYANKAETAWESYMTDYFNIPLRPSWVVFKKGSEV